MNKDQEANCSKISNSSNSEAVWRSEFEKKVIENNEGRYPKLSLARCPEPHIEHEYLDPQVWLAMEYYFAGRRKGQEEISTKRRLEINTQVWNKFDKERGEYISKSNQLEEDKFHLNNQIESLKKEIEDLSFDKNHLLELGDFRRAENQKLRELVERALVIIEDHASTQTVWIKEASEVLK